MPTRGAGQTGSELLNAASAITFDDGVEVVKILMAAYMSAEQGKTLAFPPAGLAKFVPQVATGEWKE